MYSCLRVLPDVMWVACCIVFSAVGLAQTDPASGQPLMASVTADRQEALAGEQILVTLLINARSDAFSITHGQLSASQDTLIPVRKHKFNTVISGTDYQTIEVNYVLFGSTSGVISIDPITVQAVLPVSAGTGEQTTNPKVSFTTESLEITVDTPPASDKNWFVAESVSLESSWSTDLSDVTSGVPITRYITVTAQSQLPGAIPELELESSDTIRIYPETVQLETDKSSTGVTGIRREPMKLMLTRAGVTTLPPVVVHWWNMNEHAWYQSQLASETIMVKQGTAIPVSLSLNILTPGWLIKNWLTIVLAVISLVLAAICGWLWFRLSRVSQRSVTTAPAQMHQSERVAWRRLKRAIGKSDYTEFRQSLLQWLNVAVSQFSSSSSGTIPGDRSTDGQINRLDQLASIDSELYLKVQQIESARHAESGQWAAAQLGDLKPDLHRLRKSLRMKASCKQDQHSRASRQLYLNP